MFFFFQTVNHFRLLYVAGKKKLVFMNLVRITSTVLGYFFIKGNWKKKKIIGILSHASLSSGIHFGRKNFQRFPRTTTCTVHRFFITRLLERTFGCQCPCPWPWKYLDNPDIWRITHGWVLLYLISIGDRICFRSPVKIHHSLALRKILNRGKKCFYIYLVTLWARV